MKIFSTDFRLPEDGEPYQVDVPGSSESATSTNLPQIGNKPTSPSSVHRKSKSQDGEYLSKQLVFTAVTAVFGGGFHFGFQMAIINPMADVLQGFLTNSFAGKYQVKLEESFLAWVWSAVAGMLFIGAALGAWTVPIIINKQGPSRALLYSAILLFASTPLSGLSYALSSAELFVLSRFLIGIGIGMGTTSHGVFLTEISPDENSTKNKQTSAKYRGIIGTFGGFSTNIGYIIASAFGLPSLLGTERLWPIAYYLEAIPCLFVIIVNILAFHESPVFLMKEKREEEAIAALRIYTRGVDVEFELERLRAEMKTQCRTDDLRDIWTHEPSRRALVLAVLLNITVAFSGITAVSFFGTFLLQSIGFSDNQAALANCLSSFAGTAGAIVATLGIDKVGRRLLVTGSLLALALINTSMMMLVILFNYTKNVNIGYGFLFLFIIFLFMFSAGIGPTAWFIGAELAPSTSRARVQSFSVSAQNIFCFVSPMVYYPLQSLVGPSAFLVFIIPLSSAALYFYRMLPETKGRTLEQITTSLSQREILG